jgi:uncharacterized protein
MQTVQDIADGLAVITRLLVDRPEDITVAVARTSTNPVLEIRVHSSDLGKVIGKQGRTAKSLRCLVQGMCVPTKIQATLDIYASTSNSQNRNQ